MVLDTLCISYVRSLCALQHESELEAKFIHVLLGRISRWKSSEKKPCQRKKSTFTSDESIG